jgi:hypothetical protein
VIADPDAMLHNAPFRESAIRPSQQITRSSDAKPWPLLLRCGRAVGGDMRLSAGFDRKRLLNRVGASSVYRTV